MSFYYTEDALNDLLRTVDFNGEKLFDNPEYKKLARCKVHLNNDENSIREGIVNVDYYCEKYILQQEQINKLKLGIYDINTTHIIDDSEVTYDKLAEELYVECNKKVDQKTIYDRLVGRSGIRVDLKKHLKIDLSNYTKEKIARNKLLKLLYKLEKSEEQGKKRKGKNVTLLLSKPTLENIDNSAIAYQTTHGELVNYIKNEIMKELTPKFIGTVKLLVWYIATDMPANVLNVLMGKIGGNVLDSWLFERFAMVENLLKKLVLGANEVRDMKSQNKHTLFELLFLKIIQSENIAREENLIKINQWILNLKWDYTEPINLIKCQMHQEADVRGFIKKNIKIIVLYVYNNDNPSEEQRQEVLDGVEHYEKIFDLMERHTKTKYSFYPLLDWIVACIQTYLKCKKEDLKYYNKYYCSDGNPKTLISVLKNEGRGQEAYEICWVSMVQYRYYANQGYSRCYSKFKEIEIQFSKHTISLLSIPNMGVMALINSESQKKMSKHLQYILR